MGDVRETRQVNDGERPSSSRAAQVQSAAADRRVRDALREDEEAILDPTTFPESIGRLETVDGDRIIFDRLEIPGFKLQDHRGQAYARRSPLVRRKNYQRGNPDQRNLWRREIPKRQIRDILRQRREGEGLSENESTWVFRVPMESGAEPYVFGEPDEVAEQMTTPMWGRGPSPPRAFYDVDHIVELQLADWSGEGWPNSLENLELLDSSMNRSSGSRISSAINEKVDNLLDASGDTLARDRKTLLESYHLVFRDAVSADGSQAGPDDFWRPMEIAAGNHLEAVDARGLEALGKQGMTRVFSRPNGGLPKTFDWPLSEDGRRSDWLAPFSIISYRFETEEENVEDGGSFGSFKVNVAEDHPDWKPLPEDREVDIERLGQSRYAGIINKLSVLAILRNDFEKKGASPIQVDEFDIQDEGGLYAQGRVLPELPILGDRGLAFTLRGNDFRLEQPIDTGDLRLPPPFELTDSSLVLFASTADGWGGEGRIEFALAPYGEGELEAKASSRELGFEGHFDFDSRLFETARVALAYEEGALTGSGRLAVGEGKLRGVKAASLELTVDGESVSGEGEITLSLAALEAGELAFSVSRDEGAMLSAGVTLGDAIPRVEGGELTGTIAPREEGEGYALAIAGEVNADLPGFDAGLTASLDDGLFDVEGRGAYSRGLIGGELTFGATNREVDGETGERLETPGEKITLFGAGEATIALTPWLEGRAGLAVLPQGEVELTGGIGIPDSVTLFEADPWERNLMTVRLDIPIVGFTVARQRVGIFATVGGGLDLRAEVGPGTLDELDIEVTYNPDREDETRVVGEALLAVPASAGLRLFLRGGLGAGIPVVSATLGLEAGGELGLEARAEAGVALDWQPGQGLELEARVALQGQPVFRFDLAGFAKVEADLLVRTLDLYDERWELAAAEAGGGMRFGVGFPIHYVQGEPFAMDWGDIEFQVPRVQPVALIRDLLDRVV